LSLPEGSPTSAATESRSGGWNVVGASVVGSGHIAAGRACEDAHAVLVVDDQTVCLVVADGAGSARYAAEASTLAVQTALRLGIALAEQLDDGADTPTWKSALHDLLLETRRELEALARQQAGLGATEELPPGLLHEYATTLLLAIARPDIIVAAQVGDGAVVIQTGDAFDALTFPDRGEYINESTFLTSSGFAEHAQIAIRAPVKIDGVALLTDGLQLLALNLQTGEPFAPFFRPLLQFAARPDADTSELRMFLASARVCARTDDDKTLLLAVRT
jgi:hypothetical protein